MAIATYEYGFDRLDGSGTGFSATEGYFGSLLLRSGRDYLYVSGNLDYSGGPTLGDLTGTIDHLSWSNANSSKSIIDTFLTVEDASVDFQAFVANPWMDISLFFAGDDDITGSNEDDFLFDQYGAGMGNDILHLNEGNDFADAGVGDDLVHGGPGDDVMFGGDGTDTARFEGRQGNFTLTIDATSASITDHTGSQGTDQLVEFEMLEFVSGGGITPFSLDAVSGLAQLSPDELEGFIELYIAYFNRAPDATGLAFWGTTFANGTSRAEIASLFTTQAETQAAYPDTMSNEDFAQEVYNNVLGRVPDQDGFDFWVNALESGAVGRDQFILAVVDGANMDPTTGASATFAAQVRADQAFLAAKVDIGAYYAVHRGLSDVNDATAVMALYEGLETDISDIMAEIDQHYTQALDPNSGAFIIQTIGVLDAPDLV